MVTFERNVHKRRYLLAALLTFLVFSMGLMLGLVIEGKRVEVSRERADEQRLDLGSLQLQYAYIDQLAQEGNCDALAKNFDKNINTLEESRVKLESYYDGAAVNKQEFDIIRREYTIAQFNYWLFAKKYKELCDAEIVTILFFYDDEEVCNKCNDQGFVLSYLKNIFEDDLLNFAIYGRYDAEPMVSILKNTYEVTQYPSLVIEDEKYEGFLDQDEVRTLICSNIQSHEKCESSE